MRRLGGAWVVAATLVALGLWLARLDANPLFVDEAASWSVAAQGSLGDFWHVLLHQEVGPPPFYAGLRVVVDGAGASGHAAMRLPVVLLTLPCVPLAAAVARRCGGSTRAAAGAAWLVALSPLMLEFAQQVRAYGPAATAVLAAVLLVLRAADGAGSRAPSAGDAPAAGDSPVAGVGPAAGGVPVAIDVPAAVDGRAAHARAAADGWPRAGTAVAGVAVGLAPWVHYVGWLPLLPVLAWALAVLPRPARVRLLVPVVPLWVGAAVAALMQYGNVGAGMDGVTELGGEDLRRVLAGAWDGRYAGGAAIGVLGAVGTLAGLVAAVALRGRARLIAVAGLTGPAAILVVSALGPDVVTTRYLVPTAPLLLVAVALGAARLPARVGVPAMVVLAAVGIAGVVRTLDPATGDRPDFETIAGYAVPSLRPGTVIASEDFFVTTWIAEYVGARSGVPDVGTAWGQGQLLAALCARRRVLELAAPDAAPAAQELLRAAGYAATVARTPSPEYLLVTAEPRDPAPAACAGVR